jgi:hypothetical protein
MRSLYRGVGPTIMRAAVLTSSQIASYDQVKTVLKRNHILNEGFTLHLSASLVAGFACSVTSAPFDTIKVRLMQDRARQFKNAFDCLAKLVTYEGPFALYKGYVFLPPIVHVSRPFLFLLICNLSFYFIIELSFGMCWARLGSHTVISLVVSDTVLISVHAYRFSY